MMSNEHSNSSLDALASGMHDEVTIKYLHRTETRITDKSESIYSDNTFLRLHANLPPNVLTFNVNWFYLMVRPEAINLWPNTLTPTQFVFVKNSHVGSHSWEHIRNEIHHFTLCCTWMIRNTTGTIIVYMKYGIQLSGSHSHVYFSRCTFQFERKRLTNRKKNENTTPTDVALYLQFNFICIRITYDCVHIYIW